MTHEQFITLETAKLAKQAGFDWECPTFYTETFDYTNQDGTGKFEFRRDDNLRYRNPNDDRNSFVNHKGTLLEYKFEMYSAPTQSVLQRWLREVKSYNIYISHTYTVIDCQIKSIWEVLYEKMSFLKPNSTLILEDDLGRSLAFDTYETALEAGLKECLSLIINGQ